MSLNNEAFATKFTGELDKIITEKSSVGFMADNNLRAKFVGAKTVKIPNISLQGLGDYDRENGFIKGTVNVHNTAYEMQMDRARTFTIDREDMDETGIASLAGAVMSEFVKTKVVPETDAYVISKLASFAAINGQRVNNIDTTKPLKAFYELLDNVQAEIGMDEEIVCLVDRYYWNVLRKSDELAKVLENGAFKQGEISFNVSKIDNVSIIPVSNSKMMSSFDFLAEGAGGFKAAEGSKGVYMLMLPKKACSLVKKSEKIRIFTPEENINADAYKFDYRIYYDVFVKNAYATAIWAAFAPELAFVDLPKTAEFVQTVDSCEIKIEMLTEHEQDDLKVDWYSCEDTNKSNPRRVPDHATTTLYFDGTKDPGTYYYFARITAYGATTAETSVCAITVTEN